MSRSPHAFLCRYMKDGHAFIMVYSIIARSTFTDLKDIYDQIVRVKDNDDIPVVLQFFVAA